MRRPSEFLLTVVSRKGMVSFTRSHVYAAKCISAKQGDQCVKG